MRVLFRKKKFIIAYTNLHLTPLVTTTSQIHPDSHDHNRESLHTSTTNIIPPYELTYPIIDPITIDNTL